MSIQVLQVPSYLKCFEQGIRRCYSRRIQNFVNSKKAEIADLKDRLADKTAALNAARAVASNAASGGSGGSDATASYRAEIASLGTSVNPVPPQRGGASRNGVW